MAFPSTLSAFPRPNPTDRLNSPSHSGLHNTTSSAVGQIEAVIGLEGSSSTVGTLIYDIRSPASNGGGHVQTANKGGTGQTVYAKGDLLVATSTSVLSKLSVGNDGDVLRVSNALAAGLGWAPAAAARVYTSNSVWMKPSTLSAATIICIGGGGGGSGGTAGTRTGSGGGGTSYTIKTISAANLPLAVSVLVAASVAAGVAGQNTRFGSILVAFGGKVGGSELGGSGGHSGIGSVAGFAISGQGAGSNSSAEWGGGGGGAGQAVSGQTPLGISGGSAIYGGGGGGGGGRTSVAGAGGTTQSYTQGGGGTGANGGANVGSVGGYLQGGGGGGGTVGNGPAGNGGNGGVGGGGGGGGASDDNVGGGGMGGRGEVIVIEF